MFVPVFCFAQQTQQAQTQPQTTQSTTATPDQGAVFKFSEETFDFGDIPQGTPVTHVFQYTNTGKQPIVISQVTASCGCTTPTWTKDPVAPGATGKINVTYNAAKEGTFMKTVTVLSNSNGPHYLYIKGNVAQKK